MGEINDKTKSKKQRYSLPSCVLCEVRKPAGGKSNKKGEYYVVDNSCYTDNFVGTRIGIRLYAR